MLSEGLKKEILNLIDIKIEGGYWDFKREWHLKEKKADLLHDIICMANNLENRDAYLIIGVDEEDGYALRSIKEDANRKNTQMIVDFLKDKKFAGGIRPTVYVESILINGNSIDVIVIKNSMNTPFYLTERYQSLLPNNIYTRIMDTNTPINKSADIHHVEYLWKKRFGLNLSPLEKVKFLLGKTKDWLPVGTDGIHSSDEFKNTWYNRQYPEYTINYSIDKGRFDNGRIDKVESDLYWMNVLPGPLHNSYIYNIHIKYHSTVLFAGLAIFADGGRFKRMLWNGYNSIYRYIEKDSIIYLIDNWLCNHYETVDQTIYSDFRDSLQPWITQPEYKGEFNPYNVILVFENKEEHNEFINYIKENEDSIYKSIGTYSNPYYGDPKHIEFLCEAGKKLNQVLKQWRLRNNH